MLTSALSLCRQSIPQPLRFGWNNTDQPPTDYHFRLDESNLTDCFVRSEDSTSLKPSKKLLELARACFENQTSPDSNRLFVLDVPFRFDIEPASFSNQFAEAIFPYLRQNSLKEGIHIGYPTHSQMTLQDGVFATRALNGLKGSSGPVGFLSQRRKTGQPIHSLHWELASEDPTVARKGDIVYLLLLQGKRENVRDTDGVSLFTDFNQWYQDQKFQKSLADLSEEEIADLILEHGNELMTRYTVKLPPSKDSFRFIILFNTPQQGGILHGVTPVIPVKGEPLPTRELAKRSFYSLGHLTRKYPPNEIVQ